MKLAAVFLLQLVCILAQRTPVVNLDSGPVQGWVENGVNVFRGIPFAAPPVGNLRWRPPQNPTPWSTTLQLSLSDPPSCPQHANGNTIDGKEDCLYLNVYAPPYTGTPMPVAVWIYGGGFTSGSLNADGLYDGRNVTAQHNYIMVAGNYRLGPLGYLALDGLKSESGTTGNYGTLDQVAVLKWVQRNIAAFGGDATRVTIFGQSAGAMSVCWHMASPASKGLFKAAIQESGTCDSTIFFPKYANARSFSTLWANVSGCSPNDLACLRALPVEKATYVPGNLFSYSSQYYLSPAYPDMPWGPAIDGVNLLDLPLNTILAGKGNQVAYIGGSNKNEGATFLDIIPDCIPGVKLPLDSNSFKLVLGHFFCNDSSLVNQIVAEYPVGPFQPYQTYDDATAMLIRDWFFACPTRRTASAMSNNGNSAWSYHFTYALHWGTSLDVHGAELPFVFNKPPLGFTSWTADDQTVANYFGHYWTNLIKNNDVNTGEPVDLKWPTFAKGTTQTTQAWVNINIPTALDYNYDYNVCNFWDGIQVQCNQKCGC